jgi:hypothetical protein
MQTTMKFDEPRSTRVVVCGVIRADNRPSHRKTSDCRPKIKNLCHCGRRYRSIDKILATDTQGDDEDQEDGNPSTIRVPTEGQDIGKTVFFL